MAYEIGTHALITRASYDRSVLAPSHSNSIAPVLGFDRLDTVYPFSGLFQGQYLDDYLDNATPVDPLNPQQASLTYSRRPQALERQIFEGLGNRGFVPGNIADFELTVSGWLMRGAIREDDNDVYLISDSQRDEDPWGNYLRATAHFYDPISDAPYSFPIDCLQYNCVRSTEWALGRTNFANGIGILQTARRNHFTWQDARNHYWWALTLSKAGSIPTALDRQRDSYERQIRFATTITSLGHVIHLLQDAGQPQHTRNDAHAPPIRDPREGIDALYEQYTETRVFGNDPAGGSFEYFGGGLPPIDLVPPIRLSGNSPYTIPRFRLPVYYFTTRSVDTDVAMRRGLADYSNRGYFTFGTLPKSGAYSFPPRPSVSPSTYVSMNIDTGLILAGQPLTEQLFVSDVLDVINPSYDSQSGLFSAFGGKVPVLRRSITNRASDIYMMPELAPADMGFVIDENVMRSNADALIPRAIAYSAGLIDYFFRGRLEVTPIEQNIFAVLDQNVPHTVDPDGYPRVGSGRIFGFEKVRLRLRNVTEPISESGFSGSPFPQVVASGGRLVAIARYHRNSCYKADLTGERIHLYAPPPQIVVTEPTCALGQSLRTAYQEVSVSDPIIVTSESDVPGGRGSPLPAAVEVMFDFTNDPIPVNATDLFIQVAYRGPLGDEPDAVAVGTFDAREPTFIGIFNSTDFFFNGTSYVAQNGTFPARAADNFNSCAGFPSKLIYRFTGSSGNPSLGLPFAGGETGVIRLALLVAPPTPPATTISVRSTPTMIPPPSALQRSGVIRGLQRQATKERYNASGAGSLPAPTFCQITPPSPGMDVWCFDAIKKRRGLLFGDLAQAIYYNAAGVFSDGPDVDSIPLPAFSTIRVSGTGENRFNIPGALVNCPAPPSLADGQEKLQESGIELDEFARSLGLEVPLEDVVRKKEATEDR